MRICLKSVAREVDDDLLAPLRIFIFLKENKFPRMQLFLQVMKTYYLHKYNLPTLKQAYTMKMCCS